MKRTLLQIVVGIGLLLGIWFCARPLFYDIARARTEASFVENYVVEIEEYDDETLEAEKRLAYDYNAHIASLGDNSVMHQLTKDERAVYDTVLTKPEQDTMGSIEIPALGIVARVLRGTSDAALMAGVGHCDWSSLPIGGEMSHCVLSGHSGMENYRMFDDLERLKEGDSVILTVLGEKHAYEVTGTETVLPDEVSSLTIKEGKDLLTLVTCTPYGVNTHRLLVFCERCEYVEPPVTPIANTYTFALSPMRAIPGILAAVTVLVMCVVAAVKKEFGTSHVLILSLVLAMYGYGLFLMPDSGPDLAGVSSIEPSKLIQLVPICAGCITLMSLSLSLRRYRKKLGTN